MPAAPAETTSAADFDARSYWEQRLAADYSLTGVGFRRLGPSFNTWAYRVRRERFMGAVGRLDLKTAGAKVVDVGSGTGFYVATWSEMGAQVTGMDLTETAVGELAKAYPDATFVRGDISDPAVVDQLGAGSADAVSAMDVLFHIVDDAAFQQALRNIHAVLRPGGYFLYSDLFVHGAARRVQHRVARPLVDIEQAMDRCGFEIVERAPLFVLLNDPLDTRNVLYKGLWYATAALISTSDKIGAFAGKRLYPWEIKLTGKRTESPSTELMVCRKR
jgi:2-polyprenyl-3-methyl-5-hydroxy-6-metoxy-1,4-benzoquinol methylase